MCTNLHLHRLCHNVCRQGKRWENQSSSDNKEVSECVQTYRLQLIVSVVCTQGKRWENQSSSDNKEVSECVQTYHLPDCATRKEMGKSIKFRQQRGQ